MGNRLGEAAGGVLHISLVLGGLALGIAQLIAGYMGIQHHLGTVLAIIALFLAFFARFTLPITVGAFFGAMNVWGWHWFWALIFTLPGLAFMALMIPGALATALPWGRKS
jgi:hypothetical protein